MRNKRPRVGVYVLIVGVLVIGGVLVARQRMQGTEKPEIRTAQVTRGTVTTTVSGTGVLQPLTKVEVKSNVGGQVVSMPVDEGDMVKAGQVIAKIDPSDTLATLDQVQADLEGAQSRVMQAEKGLELAKKQNSARLDSAKQAVASAKLRLAQAEKQATLQTTLTETAIEQAEQALHSAKVRLAQAEEQAEMQPKLSEASIQQARSNLASAESAYQQTKNALNSQKIIAAETALDQAKASFDLAEKELTRTRQLFAKGYVARSQVDSAEQKFIVAKAQLESARARQSTVEAEAEEDLRVAKARVDQAKAALQTAETNRAQDALRQRDVEAARAAVKQAEASLKNAKANSVQIGLKKDDIEAAKAALKQAEASLATEQANALQETVKQGDIVQAKSQVKRTTASVTNARTQLDYTTVTAPRAGIVINKLVEEGSIVPAGRTSASGAGTGVTMMEIADVSRMFSQVNIDETDIAQIHVGQEVDVTVDAYPDELFFGKVTKIAPQTVTEQNVTTVPVTVEIESPDLRLKPGMNATCDFVIERRKNVLMAPVSAIHETKNGTVVLVPEKKDGKEAQIPYRVEVGLTDNDNAEIISGLNEGVTIITAIIKPEEPGAMSSGGQSGGRPPGGMMMRRR